MSYQDTIARALRTPGGHLAIGRGGFCLHFEDSRLSGYECELIEQAAIEAGLPVIESREVSFDVGARLAVEGPMIAINRPAHPGPWHAFSEAPLAVVATAYRRAGADIHNIVDDPQTKAWFVARLLAPLPISSKAGSPGSCGRASAPSLPAAARRDPAQPTVLTSNISLGRRL